MGVLQHYHSNSGHRDAASACPQPEADIASLLITSSARASSAGGGQLQAELRTAFWARPTQIRLGLEQAVRQGTTQDSIDIGCCAGDHLLDFHPRTT